VAQGDFANWWVYWVGPIIGAVIAAFLWRYFLLEPPQPREPGVDLPQSVAAPAGGPPNRPRPRRGR
jgi:hypothetical protein